MHSESNAKNNLRKVELSTLLHNIEREKKNEIRMHNTIKQQFKVKHSVFDSYLDKGKGSNAVSFQSEASNSSFQKRDQVRPLESSSTSTSITYQDIHDMLFTDGELDIDKVLCLHLLTAHKTETLTPPMKNHRTVSFLAKDQSPLERLIERSRKRRKADNLTKLLPTYVLDVTDQDDESNQEQCLIRDGRLAERIIINDKIVQLIHTVMDALQASNPEKMKELITKAKDEDVLKTLMEKPTLKDFLTLLQRQMIIFSCDSYHLTQPFKKTPASLKLTSSSHTLKNLVSHIRRNVLQYPMHSTWRNIYEKSQGSDEIAEDEQFYESFPVKPSKIEERTYVKDGPSNFMKVHSTYDVDGTKSKPDSKSARKPDSDNFEKKSNNNTIDTGKRDSKTLNLSYKNENASLEDLSPSEHELFEKKLANNESGKKTSVLTLDDLNDNNIHNISLTELSRIINFHIKALTADERRVPKKKLKTPSLREYKNFAKGSGFVKGSHDAVGLNIFDLAKITQTIREKETEKKLNRFLQNINND